MADEQLRDSITQLRVTEDAKREGQQAARTQSSHPKGWEAGVVFDGQEGTLSTGPRESAGAPSNDEWRHLLEVWDLDPEVYEVDPNYSPQYRAWDANLGRDPETGEPCVQRFFYYKANIRLRERWYGLDIEELLKGIGRYKAPKAVVADDGEVGLVVPLSDWQIGKALADDTPVLTPDGWVDHGDLRPGDSVYGPDGRPKRVLAVTGSSLQDCWTVEFDGSVRLVASGEHRWTGWRRYKNGDGRYERRRLTWTTEQIAELRPTLRENRQYVERAFHVDLPGPIEMPDADLPVDPYLFGVWLGDGSRHSGRFTSSTDDVDHWVDQFGALASILDRPEPNTVEIRVDGLTAKLRAMGSLVTKSIPQRYLFAATSDRLALLQGLVDSDGHIDQAGRVEFVNTDRSIADAVAWLATSLGMKVTRSEKQGMLNGTPKKMVHRVWFRPDAAVDEHNVCRMKRKASCFRRANGDQSRFRFVQSVEPAGRVSAQCITVEGGLYLAGRDLVVTHNSDGDGVKGTVDRIMTGFERVEDRLAELKRMKIPVGCLYLMGMGDLVEQCLAPETEVITRDGVERIDKLAVEGRATVKSAYGKWVDAEIRSFGHQRLLRVTLSRMGARRVVWATPGHRWFRLSNPASNSAKQECVTSDLIPGDLLSSVFGRSPLAMSPFGVARGYVYGDGHRDHEGCSVCVHRGDWDSVLPFFAGCRRSKVREHNPGSSGANVNVSDASDFIKVSDCPAHFKQLPDLADAPSYLMGWAAGYFAADGTVGKTVRISSADKRSLEHFAAVCARVGIGTQPITTQTRTGINGVDSDLHGLTLIKSTIPEWFFIKPNQRAGFAALSPRSSEGNYTRQKNRGRCWRVEAVEDVGREDEVFCAVVPETQAFVLANDLLTGNCQGNYPAQPFLVQLNRREQMRLARRCLRDGAVGLSRKVPKMVMGSVGGNHGENRGGAASSGGKAKMFTTPGDNDDVAIFEMVADAFAHNEDAFGHISYVIPDEELAVVLDVYGTTIGFTHGHLATRGGTSPQQKIWAWWKDQMGGKRPIGDADGLVTGHYHHLQVCDFGPRWWIQCPSVDGGSTWWENTAGAKSAPGTVTFLAAKGLGNGQGFDQLRLV